MRRLFGRKRGDAALLEQIIDRQDPHQRALPAAPRPARTRSRPAGSSRRLLTPFVLVLVACTVATTYFVKSNWPKLVETYRHATGQPQATPSGVSIAGHATIVDGDTIEIRGQRVRLWGVDAPESSQLCQRGGRPWRCGQAAALALSDWVGERTMACIDRGDGGWNRLLGQCIVGGVDVSAWLVENGWALAFRRYSLDYVAHEDRARRMRAGIWDGQFEPPWDWRAAKRRGQK